MIKSFEMIKSTEKLLSEMTKSLILHWQTMKAEKGRAKLANQKTKYMVKFLHSNSFIITSRLNIFEKFKLGLKFFQKYKHR